ncbi:MAG: phospho-N-acetylmuramoyl-pentapeptide-transferase [Armatimonadetes bacterium]|nr:phospho-N-acetylmuramoyl-pentapeptide-transferase [Armatimonadota bacterium]
MATLALPFVVSLLLSLLFGGAVVEKLAQAKARQPISDDAPDAHKLKHGTPTMGGLLILATTLLATPFGLWHSYTQYMKIAGGVNAASNPAFNWWIYLAAPAIIVLLVFALACGIGVLDDLGKARKKLNGAGLSERTKLGLQFAVAAFFVLYLWMVSTLGVKGFTTAIYFNGYWLDLGQFYYLFVLLYLPFFGNAVNFTDGLDGLASGTTLIAALTMGAIAAVGSPALGVPAFYGAVAGACTGFLWFNAYPAKVFMGDTGSLALGMGMAAAAVVLKQELLFLVVGAVYVAEIFSMMLQRYVFKYRRVKHGIEYAKANRVFRRAPLHHHFEELGLRETQVVARFYVAALLLAAIGVLLAPYLSFGGAR